MAPASPSPELLRAECRAYARYLVGQQPTEYVLACYERSWHSAAAIPAGGLPLLDRSLLSMARLGSLPARIADGYARVFRPFCSLRRRLILLLAILENSPPSDRPLNSAQTGSGPGIVARMALTLLASSACLVAGIVLLGPLHLVSLLLGRSR